MSMKRKFKKTLMRFTGTALTTVMLFSSTVPVWAGGNIIKDTDNTAGNNTSSGSSNTNTDTDAYSDWLNDIVRDYTYTNDSKDDYLSGGVYYNAHVRQEHSEFTEPHLSEDGWQADVTEWQNWSLKPSEWVGWNHDDEEYSHKQPNRNKDTIKVVDLTYSDWSYTDKAYPIFLPDSGTFSFNHHILNDSYKDAIDEGGSMDIYRPFFDQTRTDTVKYSVSEFKDYLKEVEKTVEVDSSNALVQVRRERVQLGARTGRFIAELYNSRTGELITAETLVLNDPNGTPCVTFSGLPDGDYEVKWSSEHTAWYYTYERWYCELFAYVKETKRPILSYSTFYEKQTDWVYAESHWEDDEINPYSFSTHGGGDITVTDGGEASTWELVK